MNVRAPRIALLYLVLFSIGGVAIPGEEGPVVVPGIVRRIMMDRFPESLKEQEQLRKEYGKSFTPEYTLLFYHVTEKGRYLVAYCIGTQGNAGVGDDRLVVWDSGKIINIMAEHYGLNSGFILDIGKGRVMVVTNWYGRHTSGGVNIYYLGDQPKEVFKFPDVNETCDSALYFVDIDKDEFKDILIDRSVYHEKEDKWVKKPIAYRYDPKTNTYAVLDMGTEDLQRRIAAAEKDASVPRIGHGPPRALPEEERKP